MEEIPEFTDEPEDEEFKVSTTANAPLASTPERMPPENRAAIEDFLGEGNRVNMVSLLPRYYGELLTWALQRHIEKDGWQVFRTLGYHWHESVYIDVSTDCDKREDLLMDGQFLVEKSGIHFVITVDINLSRRNSVQVEGPASLEKEVNEFIQSIMTIAKEQNFYRGKKIEFAGRLHFLDVKARDWDTILLNAEIKAEIRANTIDFLRKRSRWSQYGIPLKRGILLAGEPGTGKTVVCKALMAEAEGITCIVTNAYRLDGDDYITELYELAQDLSPCIVFIEDIDLIGLNRIEFGYNEGAALHSLLNVMDGVEEKQEIVTVATTNNLETLDRALSQRPSRFDRVVKLPLPSLEERKELVHWLCRKIPIDEIIQDYIAGRAEGCTPAQLQEIVFSLVIGSSEEPSEAQSSYLRVNRDQVDGAILKVNGKNGRRLGFCASNNGNGHKPGYADALRLA